MKILNRIRELLWSVKVVAGHRRLYIWLYEFWYQDTELDTELAKGEWQRHTMCDREIYWQRKCFVFSQELTTCQLCFLLSENTLHWQLTLTAVILNKTRTTNQQERPPRGTLKKNRFLSITVQMDTEVRNYSHRNGEKVGIVAIGVGDRLRGLLNLLFKYHKVWNSYLLHGIIYLLCWEILWVIIRELKNFKGFSRAEGHLRHITWSHKKHTAVSLGVRKNFPQIS